jgi:hypothetical protein
MCALPERRSHMFPQRSQYFSSTWFNFDNSFFSFITSCPLQEKNTPSPAEGEDCRSWTRCKGHGNAGDRARLVCDDLSVMKLIRRVLIVDLPFTDLKPVSVRERNQVNLRSSLRVK